MKAISERLKELREYLGITQTTFADSIGLGTSTIAMMEIGKREILDRHIKTICANYNVNENWFKTGQGNMFNNPNELETLTNKYNLSNIEVRILQNYLNMNSDQRKVFTEMLLQLADNTKNDSNSNKDNSLQILAASSGEI
jgi:hypothetical protein